MVRRTFTLQMYDTTGVCLSPGDCGTVCHCGSPVQRHGWLDGHSAVAMFCPVCEPPDAEQAFEDSKVDCPDCGQEMWSKRATCSACNADLMPAVQRTEPPVDDDWNQCETKGCAAWIPPEARLCFEHSSRVKI